MPLPSPSPAGAVPTTGRLGQSLGSPPCRRRTPPVAAAAAPPSPPPNHQTQQALLDALLALRPASRLTLASVLPLASTSTALLADAACAARDADPAFRQRGGASRLATFSPKAFLPLTRLCRDACGYCTFVRQPDGARAAYMTFDQAVSLAHAARDAGCTEALLTCGDAPETVHPAAAAELASLGFPSTVALAAAVAGAVTAATGLLVHSNVGLVTPAEALQLRAVTASQGVMLETVARAAADGPGSPHDPATCPDKAPPRRLAALAALAAARVPTTSGLLLGLGESRAETLAALLALRRLNQGSAWAGCGTPGFLQELIIQPFTPKAGTRMAGRAGPSGEDLAWAISAARLVMGPGVAIQAPPNLAALLAAGGAAGGAATAGGGAVAAAAAAAAGAASLLRAGACDFGGISPVTADHISPDAPWPPLGALADAAASAGLGLAPRLPVYPPFFTGDAGRGWVDGRAGAASPRAALLRAADGTGLARGGPWRPGGGGVARVLGRLLDADWPAVPPCDGAAPSWGPRGPTPAHALTRKEAAALLGTRGADLEAVLAAADALRARTLGDRATFVTNRNINYTNICSRSCDFCAFSASAPRGGKKGDPFLPSFPSASGGAPATVAAAEAPYFYSPDAIAAASADAWAAGATEVCMQGGIAPAFEADGGVRAYEEMVGAARAGAPGIHIHALSPLEVWTAAGGVEAALPAVLRRLADAGLNSLPGTAAEVLVARVRAALFPGALKKLGAREWLRVMQAAHGMGLRSTSTLMFGAANDAPADWAAHLEALRALQARSGGFTEFVPLPFVPDLAPGFAAGRLRAGPTRRDCLAVTAVARLFLLGSIDHVQASWPKLGPAALPRLLAAGADDMGGVLMRESISRAAGAGFGAALSPADLAAAARAAGRTPAVRTTLYGRAPAERVSTAFGGVERARAAGVEVVEGEDALADMVSV